MTTASDTVQLEPSVRRPSSAVAVVGATVIVVGWVLYRHYAFPHLEQRVFEWDGLFRQWWAVNLTFALLLAVPYAVALLVWARPGRRVAAALVAVGAGVYFWGIYEVFSNYVWAHLSSSQAASQTYAWVSQLGVALLVTLAWCVARRRGRAWIAGLAVALAVSAALYLLQLHSVWWRTHVILDRHSYSWVVIAAVYVAPFVAGALACWALERRTRTPEMGSSA
jgi:hypothetical protein